jgi:hypothetical protein
MSSLLAEKKKSLGLTNLLLGARAGQMAPPPAHHHHQEKAYADFTHEQKEQEVGGAMQRRLVRLVLCCSQFYGIVFCFVFTRRGGGAEVEGYGFQLFSVHCSLLQYPRNQCHLCIKKNKIRLFCCMACDDYCAIPFRFALVFKLPESPH